MWAEQFQAQTSVVKVKWKQEIANMKDPVLKNEERKWFEEVFKACDGDQDDKHNQAEFKACFQKIVEVMKERHGCNLPFKDEQITYNYDIYNQLKGDEDGITRNCYYKADGIFMG